MEIRLTGTTAETGAAVAALSNYGRSTVLEVSDPYPNRVDSALVRVCVEAHLAHPDTTAAGWGGERR